MSPRTGFGLLRAPSTRWWRALDRRALLGEHRARDPQRVLEVLEALLERREADAVGVVLRLEPGGAEPEHARPPEMTSSVVDIFASSAGLR